MSPKGSTPKMKKRKCCFTSRTLKAVHPNAAGIEGGVSGPCRRGTGTVILFDKIRFEYSCASWRFPLQREKRRTVAFMDSTPTPDETIQSGAPPLAKTQYRAIVCNTLSDDISVIRMEQRDIIPPGPGEARIAMRACGVNFTDILTIQGKYQHKPELPFIPGTEGAGDIVEVGEGVLGLAVGNAVGMGMRTGGFAESIVVTEQFDLPRYLFPNATIAIANLL